MLKCCQKIEACQKNKRCLKARNERNFEERNRLLLILSFVVQSEDFENRVNVDNSRKIHSEIAILAKNPISAKSFVRTHPKAFCDNNPEIGILVNRRWKWGLFHVNRTQRVFVTQRWSRYEKHSILSKETKNYEKKGLGWVFAPIRHIWKFGLQVQQRKWAKMGEI